MIELYEKPDYIPLLNKVGVDYVTCCSRDTGLFEHFDADEIPTGYIEVLYAEALKMGAMRSFWKRQGRRDVDFPGARRFHAFIRNRGLESQYYEMEAEYAEAEVKAWAKYYGLPINWNCIEIVGSDY